MKSLKLLSRNSKKIYGICLSSAIDYLIHAVDLKVGKVLKSPKVDRIPAGKLINSLRSFECLEIPVTSHVFIGENEFALFSCFADFLNMYLHTVSGNTRCNFTIISSDKNAVTHITSNSNYSLDEQKTFDLLKNEIHRWSDNSVLILSGSLPSGLSSAFYKRLIAEANDKGILVILDTNGEALSAGIGAKPFSITPNLRELNQLKSTNYSTENLEKVILEIDNLWQKGIHAYSGAIDPLIPEY